MERELLHWLLSNVAPERLGEVGRLEVFARCGCGKCPTIMFQPTQEEGGGADYILADFQGGSEEAGLVGSMLWERDGEISELEAWSIDGAAIRDWPALDTIRPIKCAE